MTCHSIACMAGIKREGEGVGKGRKGKGGNVCYKSPVFCIMPTNFLVIQLRILSIYCQSVHQSEHSAHPVPLHYVGIFVCQLEYLSSRVKSFCSQSIGILLPVAAAEMNKRGFFLQVSLSLSPHSPLLFSSLPLPSPFDTSYIPLPIALFASLSRLGPWHEKRRDLGT